MQLTLVVCDSSWNVCVRACVRACVGARPCHWKWRHVLIILESSLRKTHSYFFQELGILWSVALTTIDWLAWEATSLNVELSFQERSEASRLASPVKAVKSVSPTEFKPIGCTQTQRRRWIPTAALRRKWRGKNERRWIAYHTQLSRFHHGSP